jgi:hypothetical protein
MSGASNMPGSYREPGQGRSVFLPPLVRPNPDAGWQGRPPRLTVVPLQFVRS